MAGSRDGDQVSAPPSVRPSLAEPPVPKKHSLGKRFRRLPAVVRTKVFFRRLFGRDPWLRVEVRPHLVEMGGWEYCPEGLTHGSVVYAAGVGENLDFELELIRRHGVEVHAFDPTPGTQRWVESAGPEASLHFHPWAVAGADSMLTLYARKGRDAGKVGTMLSMTDDGSGDAIEVPAFTLTSLMHKLGHDDIALLKLDIEGAEYPVLDELLTGDCRPRQILVEFHHRFPGLRARDTARVVAGLHQLGYRIAALSLTGREVTFVRHGRRRGDSM